MKLGTCLEQNTAHLAVIENDSAVIPSLDPGISRPEYQSIQALIEAGPDAWRRLAQEARKAAPAARRALDQLKLTAPIPRPNKNIMCLGWNYAEHVAESATTAKARDLKTPEHAVVFTKNPTSVIGQGETIPQHAHVTQELDWEVELAVIIGRGGRSISAATALDHVFGYTIINDISARDLQFQHKQFFLGKSLDGACPMGPWIVTSDEIPDPQDLDLNCKVNDVVKQNSNTRFMIFNVAQIIEILSRGMPLEPGDIIATGTPSGVGFARSPAEFLKAGDTVQCEIERIGTLRNSVR